MSDFARILIEWQARHGRHDLPWQHHRDAYRVWLSEIMLQQTQVETVIPYYLRFIERFPDLSRLAQAPLAEVLALWSGLGYYARARNLHRCARQLAAESNGEFPREPAAIARLPGIGRSTAAAIAVFAFGARAAILDGNVKRVLCRHFGVEGFPGRSAVEARLWSLAESLLPKHRVDRYIQAQMDLGATVCTRRPDCSRCPLQETCVALGEDRVLALPTPRPRRAQRRRSGRFLVLREGNRVLLQRRPAAGVWGGLLSLPEIEDEMSTVSEWARRTLGTEFPAIAALPVLQHAFTHFTLEMRPLLIDWGSSQLPVNVANDADWQWLPLDQLDAAPLPAPVRRILATLRCTEEVNRSRAGDAGEGTAG